MAEYLPHGLLSASIVSLQPDYGQTFASLRTFFSQWHIREHVKPTVTSIIENEKSIKKGARQRDHLHARQNSHLFLTAGLSGKLPKSPRRRRKGRKNKKHKKRNV
ncbi:hypothetical protein Y1Q_0016556 [Alligator mississippiensis]|uniref:Uncharacterized protein n=1 Tax=Alligator mississippiensis TaxID=8496 RepID=A0A151N3N6_ALLMI|nr:hypothetical protein Y1Q_0016556 [Alligator mississippiensis]